jgi:hypothetical protein
VANPIADSGGLAGARTVPEADKPDVRTYVTTSAIDAHGASGVFSRGCPSMRGRDRLVVALEGTAQSRTRAGDSSGPVVAAMVQACSVVSDRNP